MTTAWHWRHLSAVQRRDALSGMAGTGSDGKGKPPSGYASVLWVQDGDTWRWRSELSPTDVEQGVEIGKPAPGEPVIGDDEIAPPDAAIHASPVAFQAVSGVERSYHVVLVDPLAPSSGAAPRAVKPKAKPKKRRR
jgi:hypothetical protein